MIFFEFSNINAILGDEVANPIMVGGNFEALGSKFRNETEGLLPPHHLRPLSKKKRENYD